MNKDEQIAALEIAVDTLQKAVSVLQANKGPLKPEIPWESGKTILEDYYARRSGVTITDNTRSKWPQGHTVPRAKPAPISLKFEHPRRGVPPC